MRCEGICESKMDRAQIEEKSLELLFAFLEQFGLKSFPLTLIDDFLPEGIDQHLVIYWLTTKKYIEINGSLASVAHEGETKIDSMPAEWLVRHAPISCHSHQK